MTRHRSEEERREQILRAAFHVFCNDGYDGATIDKIATRARLAKGTVYFYYASKAALFDALVERECAGLIPPMRDAATLLAWPFFVVLLARAVHHEPTRALAMKLWPEQA